MADNAQEAPTCDGAGDPGAAQAGRFLTIPDVAAELAVSVAQVRALLDIRALRGIQIGGRGQWRIERAELESFIARAYQAQEDRHDQPQT
jgi:excisionase family DNA binding protein